MAAPEKDPITGEFTTGHVWNGIKELRTPVPVWWLSVWLVSIAFAVGYAYVYPSIPTTTSVVSGLTATTARDDLRQEVADARQAQAAYLERIRSTPLEAIAASADLARFAFNGGRAAFAVNCIACHGGGGGGQLGQFPSLVDDDWLWGGQIEQIQTTIRHGIRNGSDDARTSMMPAFAGTLSPADISQVTQYVLALNPRHASHNGRSSLPGAAVYDQNCAGCHGPGGEGNHDLGAPRLNDDIWLFGGRPDQIAAQIARPRLGVMPAFGSRLSDETVKMLAFYVHSLGGGEKAAP